MADDKVIGVRFELPLLARIDTHLENLKAKIPGSRLTRADAIRSLAVTALDSLGVTVPPPAEAPVAASTPRPIKAVKKGGKKRPGKA